VNITLNGGELQMPNCAHVTLDPNRIILLAGSGTLTAFGCVTPTSFIIPGQITGPGSLTKAGPGTVELAYSGNDYLGKTIVSAGILQIDNIGALGGGPGNLQIAAGTIASVAYPIDQALLGRVNPISTGTIALATDSANDLDFNAPNLGRVSLGALGQSNYSGHITPAAGVYQLGVATGTLNLTAQDALSGNSSVQIGLDNSSVGTVAISNSNSVGGDTIVHGGLFLIDATVFGSSHLETKA
jgi:autotransporter-associated beta strand protein